MELVRDFLILDSSNFPVVEGKYQSFVPSLEEFLQAQRVIEQFLDKHENFVLILDFSIVSASLSSEYRVVSARWATRMDSVFVRQKVKIAFYTPSLTSRIVMKGALIMSKPGYPYVLASTLTKARKWAVEQFAKSNPQALMGDSDKNNTRG